MRTFIAVKLPAEIKDALNQTEQELKNHELKAKWVPTQNLHLTLKFLGEIKQEQLESIKNILRQVAKNFNPFTLNLTKFGFFPKAKRPRVFFISTDQETILKEITQTLETQLEKLGFPKENRFKSHITLLRFKGTKNVNVFVEKVKTLNPPSQSFPVTEITLFKSTLTQKGATYEELCNARLG